MKMDEMNAYFEAKGFTVDRTHSTIDGKSMYQFKIEKEGRRLIRTFEYPGGVATHIKNLKQEEFLDDTLKVFETLYPGVKDDVVQYSDIITTNFLVDEKKRAEENNCNINFSCEVFEGCFRIYFMLRDKIYDKTYVNDLYVSFHCTNLGDVRRNVVNIIEELYKEMEKNRMKMYYNSVYGTTGFLSQYPPIVKNIDVIPAKEIWKMGSWINTNIKIKNVIFNDPATIVFWSDGSKTVVKCQDDDWFDPEKGLTMAISKKALGNKGNYCNELKKWLPKEKSEVQEFNYIGNVESITKLNVHSIGRNLIPAYSEEGFIDGMKHTVGITKEATTIAEAVNTKNEEDAKKRESVQKAYEILTQLKNNKGLITKECYEDAVEGILDHLDEALED